MAKYSLNLRNKIDPEKETPIYLIIRFDKNKLTYATGKTIKPKFWNDAKQIAIQTNAFPEFPEFNRGLNNLIKVATDVFMKYENENINQVPNVAELRELLDIKFDRTVKTKPIDLIGFIESYIEESKTRLNKKGKPLSASILKVYNQTIRDLKIFVASKYKKHVFSYDNVDYSFIKEYTKFLTTEKKFATNTMGKHLKTLKSFFIEAQKRGLMPNFKPNIIEVMTEEVETIALSVEELKKMIDLDLSQNKRLEQVRDLFIIGANTALRYSDYSRLKPENIITDKNGNKNIVIKTKKTGVEVHIAIMPDVENILVRYDWKFPKALSNQKMNEYLKEIGELAGIDEYITKTITKAGINVTKRYKKFELITTHTARRSACTNFYNMGIPILNIMGISTHKTESSFMKYIKITPEEHANKMRELWPKPQTNVFKIA